MPITLKVFGIDECYCTSWKWRATALKWRKLRIHQIKDMDFTDKNVSIFLPTLHFGL